MFHKGQDSLRFISTLLFFACLLSCYIQDRNTLFKAGALLIRSQVVCGQLSSSEQMAPGDEQCQAGQTF